MLHHHYIKPFEEKYCCCCCNKEEEKKEEKKKSKEPDLGTEIELGKITQEQRDADIPPNLERMKSVEEQSVHYGCLERFFAMTWAAYGLFLFIFLFVYIQLVLIYGFLFVFFLLQ